MNDTVWSVGELCQMVNGLLASRFGGVWVRGEISGFTQASSGHCYFSLKDAQGQLRCAMFRRAASGLKKPPANGDQVELLGRLGVYEARGDLQLVVEEMRPVGQGAWYEEFLRLKAKLEREGLFDPQVKRALTHSPRAIGLVTSLGAAALHDVATALRRRVPHIPVLLAHALVQGAQAPASLIQALNTLYASPEVDVILLVRGGGSIEDLWAFNDEALVRHVRQSPVPLICGVGHETDFTLCDFAADLRAPTPTAAAELCARPRQEWWVQLTGLATGLQRAGLMRLDRHAQRLDRLHQALGRPQSGLQGQSRRLAQWALKLSRSGAGLLQDRQAILVQLMQRVVRTKLDRLNDQKVRLDQLQTRLALLNPRHVLQRGYSWTMDEQGRALTRAAHLSPGMRVRGVFVDGEVGMTVDHPTLQR